MPFALDQFGEALGDGLDLVGRHIGADHRNNVVGAVMLEIEQRAVVLRRRQLFLQVRDLAGFPGDPLLEQRERRRAQIIRVRS